MQKECVCEQQFLAPTGTNNDIVAARTRTYNAYTVSSVNAASHLVCGIEKKIWNASELSEQNE